MMLHLVDTSLGRVLTFVTSQNTLSNRDFLHTERRPIELE